ncbi:MAG: AAA family ATPase [Leptonema sp. (in: bacteria)]
MQKFLQLFENQNFKIVQTHASILMVQPPFVYKIKKNVNFGFLDFSTKEKRLYYSILEVQLNQRLCKGIYQSIELLFIEKQKIRFKTLLKLQDILQVPKEELMDFVKNIMLLIEEECEFAIKMSYIEDSYFLKNQKITFDKLQNLANYLFDFYDSIEIMKKSFIKKAIKENLSQVQKFIHSTIDLLSYKLIKKFNVLYFKKYHTLLKKRIKKGWIRNCHGDLHLEHIIYRNDSICIYDCIEFNEEFRTIDIANDIAFLCMDLDFHGYFRESQYLINLFYKKYYDFDFLFLQDFYRSYRAFVRGKIYSLKILSDSILEEEKKISINLAKSYFRLSLQYALKGIHPTIFIFMGRIGSGKSTYAQSLCELLNTKTFSSDVIRKELFGIHPWERTPENLKKMVYSKLITYIVYNKMIRESIDHAYKKGVAVLDATFATRTLRNLAVFRFFEENCKVVFIEIQAKKEMILERLKKRMQSAKETSDAGIQEFLDFYDSYQPPYELPENQKITIQIDQEYPINQIFISIVKRILNHRFTFESNYF